MWRHFRLIALVHSLSPRPACFILWAVKSTDCYRFYHTALSCCSASPQCMCAFFTHPPVLSCLYFPTSVSSVLLSSFFFFRRWKSLNLLYTDASVFLWILDASSAVWMTHVTFLAHRRKGVEVLMDDLQVSTDEFSYGRSKIFIRNPRTVQEKKYKLPLCRWSWVLIAFNVGSGVPGSPLFLTVRCL